MNKISIIMGSTSDMPVMEAAAKFLNEMQIPFEINALSAHRSPEKVTEFSGGAAGRGIRVIIAADQLDVHLVHVVLNVRRARRCAAVRCRRERDVAPERILRAVDAADNSGRWR